MVEGTWKLSQTISRAEKTWNSKKKFDSRCNRKKVRCATTTNGGHLGFWRFFSVASKNQRYIHFIYFLNGVRVPNQPSNLLPVRLVTDSLYFPLLHGLFSCVSNGSKHVRYTLIFFIRTSNFGQRVFFVFSRKRKRGAIQYFLHFLLVF